MRFRGEMVTGLQRTYLGQAVLRTSRFTRWLVKDCQVRVSAATTRAVLIPRKGCRRLLLRQLRRHPLQFSHEIYLADDDLGWRTRSVPVTVL